jgi:arginine decarboxylase
VRLAQEVAVVGRMLASHAYRSQPADGALIESTDGSEVRAASKSGRDLHYFAVLVVDQLTPAEEDELRAQLRALREPTDDFVYDLVVVPSFEDALIAVRFNHEIQACIIRYSFPLLSSTPLAALRHYLRGVEALDAEDGGVDRGSLLGEHIRQLRPELDLYLVTDVAPEALAVKTSHVFGRVFYRQENYQELHLTILDGVERRYETPFFTALKEYSRRPTGVFHALPISGGNSRASSTGSGCSSRRPPRRRAASTRSASRPARSATPRTRRPGRSVRRRRSS